MKRATPKLEKYNEEFRIVSRYVRQRSKGVCEAAPFVAKNLQPSDEVHEAVVEFLMLDCGMRVDHVHHRKYRSRGGTNHISNLLGLCEAHHSWTHSQGGFGEPANLLRLALSTGEDETL